MTFSIAARCARTGQFGSAVVSSSPAVAARCAWARAGVGAVTTQNVTDPRLGPAGLDLLARGLTADECCAVLARTASGSAFRQLTIVDRHGGTAVWSGSGTLGLYGSARGVDVVSAGNLLADIAVPGAIVQAFAGSDPALELGDRLLLALQAGLAAGGEAGPVHSAGMVVVDREAWPLTDLRVDWDERPIGRLADIWAVWRPQMYDYVERALNPDAAPSYGVPGDE
ncbi:hypothetical protein AA13595_2538 [Gluconacetobacter johannae DSM 13595]|uniref:DUF1028 domain-containing protein n=1 Tax=Gluconacetobacter johannae TaxID=112140 RepID=A0A7W4J6F4_9PROT|nr:DUF1028 domain-containing protein [Gluconacetobacter johannae]MBB2175474.1 DUF1028 domain-containing protein [Gluconacetobacter johannae]GBQ89022.1 hypothetical protein AA13595_2538 [Gluconacetobacter johannae DSM 13595]